MSGTSSSLELFVKAAFAQVDKHVTLSTIPFGTLQQHLLSTAPKAMVEAFLIFPWDLSGVLDWRSGLPTEPSSADSVLREAVQTINRIKQRKPVALIYVDAIIPPVTETAAKDAALALELKALVTEIGGITLGSDAFSLPSYLALGTPSAGNSLSRIAQRLAEEVVQKRPAPLKVLVTDLDDTLWQGVIAEDGLDEIQAAATGLGFRHFIFQTMAKKMKSAGVILAAVTRNNTEEVLAALAPGRMVLDESDFVCIVATYQAKSVQIAELAKQLNLGLGQFVFVDDNPIELEEVHRSLPEVTCLEFPKDDGTLPAFLRSLQQLFGRDEITAEDRQRTDLYRSMFEGFVPGTAKGADLTTFLFGLEMQLTIHDRTHGQHGRAIQLLNKTNQFNLNGRHVECSDVNTILRDGGALYTASLTDRVGNHGEIIALLIDCQNIIRSFAMSCRVFQRRIEYAMLAWLLRKMDQSIVLDVAKTQRNTPFRQFIEDPSFSIASKHRVACARDTFLASYSKDLELFSVIDLTIDEGLQ
jgi:FkbH-like protein